MQIRELSIPDSFEITPVQHTDDRGAFFEGFRQDLMEQVIGHSLNLRQMNTSISRRGVVRGIHFADLPPGQAKYVTVTHGVVLDFIIDIRLGSPTFGQWDSTRLDTVDRRAIYLGEGLGHAFVALTNEATVSYLVSDTFSPTREHGIDPLDPEIGLVFPAEAGELILSSKDTEAPTLADAAAQGLLPTWDEVRAFHRSLNAGAL